MKKVIQSRRRRLMEALQSSAFSENIETPEEIQNQLEALHAFSKMQPQTSDMLNYKLNNMKIRILENWELTKKKAVERLSEEVDELERIQQNIERRENELDELGVNFDDPLLKRINAIDKEKAINLTTKVEPIKQPLQQLAHSTPIQQQQQQQQKKIPKILAEINKSTIDDCEKIIIGPNGTTISKGALNSINWSLSGAAVTRKILMEVFDRDTLAFHTLTGKPSPAFMDCVKPSKNPLDPAKVADIIHIVTTNLDMTPKEVRSAITTKCADENKMYRQRMKRQGR